MADFKINPGKVVWLHGSAFKPGNEAVLEEAGFSDEAREEQAQRGVVTLNKKRKRTKKSSADE